METKNFTTTLLVEQTPAEVFNSINNVRGWWLEEIEGSADQLNDEFTYHYEDVHSCKMKLIEVVPFKKVVWLVLDNYFSFTGDKSEWIGNKIIFEITAKGNKTHLRFTHQGLVLEYGCFDVCGKARTDYLQNSLKNLIISGKGAPNPKESKHTQELKTSK